MDKNSLPTISSPLNHRTTVSGDGRVPKDTSGSLNRDLETAQFKQTFKTHRRLDMLKMAQQLAVKVSFRPFSKNMQNSSNKILFNHQAKSSKHSNKSLPSKYLLCQAYTTADGEGFKAQKVNIVSKNNFQGKSPKKTK